MRVRFLALSWSLGTMLALQSPIQAQAADSQLPVSIDRVRAGLKQPPSLFQQPPPADMPTFRMEIRERLFVVPPIELEKPFDPTFGLPSLGELLLDGIEHVRSSAVAYKRRRAERRARNEVDGALAAFCALRECSTPGK